MVRYYLATMSREDIPHKIICLFIYSYLIYYILKVTTLPLLLLAHPYSPHIYSSSFCLQKRADFPGISNKYSITVCNRTRHIPHIWTRQPSRRNRIPKVGKVVKIACPCPAFTVRSQIRTPTHKLHSHKIYAEDLD